jgi:hypothetical protein
VTLVFVVVTVLVVTAIGLVSVGGVTARLTKAPPRTLFDLDEAVDFVADRLPPHAAGQVSYDELRLLLGWHLDYLERVGIAAEDDGTDATTPGRGSDEPDGTEVSAEGGPGSPAPEVPDDPAVVVAEDEGVAYVLGQAGEAGLDIDDVAVVEVIEVEARYLAAIGALGSPVGPGPDV